MKRLGILAVSLLLAGCGSRPDRAYVEGYLLAQGVKEPIVRDTRGDMNIDKRACGENAVLFAFVSKAEVGLACGGDRSVWIIARSPRTA